MYSLYGMDFQLFSNSKKLYIGENKATSIYYNNSQMVINPNQNSSSPLLINGTTLPFTNSVYSLGNSSLRWLKGWFSGLDVQGNTTLNGTTTQTGNLNQINGNATINNFYGGMWMHNDTGLSGTFNSTYQ
jgi:heat shock protein HslJ